MKNCSVFSISSRSPFLDFKVIYPCVKKKQKTKNLRFTFPDAQLNFRDCFSKFQPSKTDQTKKSDENQINICY